MKYFFTVLGTLFLSIAIYHLLIRPYPVIRFLFGSKKDKNEAVKKDSHLKKEDLQVEQLQGAIS